MKKSDIEFFGVFEIKLKLQESTSNDRDRRRQSTVLELDVLEFSRIVFGKCNPKQQSSIAN